VFSLAMALTDWTFRRGGSIRFVGLQNFIDLLQDKLFWFYFYNTAFLMIAIPISIAGSLFLAILLCQRLRGIVFFRTLFYLPHFTAGVALYVLWKHLYNPEFGPINTALRPVLGAFEHMGRTWPGWSLRCIGGAVVLIAAAAFLVPVWLLLRWGFETVRSQLRERSGRTWPVIESVLVSALGIVLGALFFGALAGIFYLAGDWILSLPRLTAQQTLQPPQWLASIQWAKPAIMIMGVWTAIGGGNMLLYIAGISNIPQELYEAAEIDGAGAWARMRYVTWPQLRPTTFFIVIMSLIGGLQGGFEQARVMTNGGPAGSTTTLSYYIYSKGFEAREFGYASAVAWVLFIIIFVITALNWRYGRGGDTDVT
jgi:multiple sugar transport system permease protein